MTNNLKILTDEDLAEIVTLGKSDSDQAFKEIYQRYSGRLYLYVRKIMNDAPSTDDIFHDSFVNLFKALKKGAQVAPLKFYLFKIARNLCFNEKRTHKPVTIPIEDFHNSFVPNFIEQEELLHIVESALELIPEEHKEAFILQNFEGLSYTEIAEITEVPLTTVRNRIVRAKRKLREILQPYFETNNKLGY